MRVVSLLVCGFCTVLGLISEAGSFSCAYNLSIAVVTFGLYVAPLGK